MRVPKENVIGEVNRGWYAAMSTLDFERTGIENSADIRRMVDDLVDYAKATPWNGGTLAENPSATTKLAEMRINAEISRMLSYRVMWLQSVGQVPNYEASVAKAFGSEMAQQCVQSAMELLGMRGQLVEGSKWVPFKGYVERAYLSAISRTIAGGTSEVQRNIIATRGPRAAEGGLGEGSEFLL